MLSVALSLHPVPTLTPAPALPALDSWAKKRTEMKSLVAIALSSTVILTHIVWALEEDRKHHGPLDGHAVEVYGILQEMDLPPPTLAECRGVAERSQDAWRDWFKIHRAKVEQYQARIEELKGGDNRADLKTVLAEKKKFMHTAPSLLRGPEALKEVLSGDQYVAFLAKLGELKKELHSPKPNQPNRVPVSD